MIPWKFNAKEYEEANEFKPAPPGTYRVRIDETEETTSKTGKPMIKLTLKISGYPGKLFHYIVFDRENSAMTNKNLGDVFESFNIPQGDMNTLRWRGKSGAAVIKHREYEGKALAAVSYFLTQRKQAELELPNWTESQGTAYQTPSAPVGASVRDNPAFNEYENAPSGAVVPF